MVLPRYNVAPAQEVPIVRQNGAGGRAVAFARWGLVPGGDSGGRRSGARNINARSETVFDRTPFRRAVRDRRCLIPATGFVEWKKQGRSRLPFHVRPAEASVWAMAGVWSRWRAPDGSWRLACSVLTTRPNEAVAALHDRMPVIIEKEAYRRWLDPSVTEREPLEPLFAPIGVEHAVVEPISVRINHVRHDDPACLEPRKPDEGPKRPQLSFDF